MHAAAVFSLLELLFLVSCVVLAFLTARSLRGGVVGRGIARGFSVMALGHWVMQVESHFGIDVFAHLSGQTRGSIAWVLALSLTWGLSGLGFMSFNSVSSAS